MCAALATGAAGVTLAASLAVTGAQAVETVNFVPGVYSLAESNLGPVADTLTVTVSGGVASFVLAGADNATFSVPDGVTPSGGGANPDYQISAFPITTSWDPSVYTYLTFWSTASSGGVTAGDQAGDQGTNLFNTFQSTVGTGQVFTVSGVPEPGAWALMITGFGLAGLALRRRQRVLAQA